MGERVLPSRDSFKRSGVTLMDAKPILAAYVRGELQTEAEWREAIDYEAANVELAKQVAADRVYDAFAILDAALPDREV